MGEPRIDSLHDPFEDQLSAARYKAERDAAVQELSKLRGEATTMSPYDLLPEDDLQALRWVREQGGLAEVEKRIMPEGYEWPRYESGELVDVGDNVVGRFSADAIKVRSVELVKGKTYLREGCKTDRAVLVFNGERLRRPPVPAGDGKPLEVGQTVWNIEDGAELYVYDIDPKWGVGVSWLDDGGEKDTAFIDPGLLTHTKPEPDSWEQIEKDAMNIDLTLDSEWGGNPTDARDLVRRAKALAERGV